MAMAFLDTLPLTPELLSSFSLYPVYPSILSPLLLLTRAWAPAEDPTPISHPPFVARLSYTRPTQRLLSLAISRCL